MFGKSGKHRARGRCLGRLQLNRVDKNNFALFMLAREHRKECLLAHGAVNLAGVNFGGGGTVRYASTLPDRRAAGAVARPSGALLLPGLLASAAPLPTSFFFHHICAPLSLH